MTTVIHSYNAEKGADHHAPYQWALELGMASVYTAGPNQCVLGAVSPDTPDDEIVRAFAYALDHRRYAVSWLNIMWRTDEEGNSGIRTRQIKVAWDHPEMVAVRERLNDSRHEMAVEALATGDEPNQLLLLQTLASEAQAESFARVARDLSEYPMAFAEHLCETVDFALADHPESKRIRDIHTHFHKLLHQMVETTKSTRFGTTHAKLNRLPQSGG